VNRQTRSGARLRDTLPRHCPSHAVALNFGVHGAADFESARVAFDFLRLVAKPALFDLKSPIVRNAPDDVFQTRGKGRIPEKPTANGARVIA
jgi:hypothetical protein